MAGNWLTVLAIFAGRVPRARRASPLDHVIRVTALSAAGTSEKHASARSEKSDGVWLAPARATSRPERPVFPEPAPDRGCAPTGTARPARCWQPAYGRDRGRLFTASER